MCVRVWQKMVWCAPEQLGLVARVTVVGISMEWTGKIGLGVVIGTCVSHII